MAQRRVKLSWQEALGPEPAPQQKNEKTEKKNRKNKKKEKKEEEKKQENKKKERRPRRHPNDVRTEQDMDAIAGFDDSSGDELDGELDTFGGAGFVLVDLETELEELALTATVEGYASVRSPARKKEKKKKKKEKQTQKLLEEVKKKEKLLEEKKEEVTEEKSKKQKKKNKKDKQAEKVEQSVPAQPTKKEMKKEKGSNDRKSNGSKGEANDASKKAKKTKKQNGSKNQTEELEEKPAESGADGNPKKSAKKDSRGNSQVTYSEYLDRDVVIRGLETGGLLQGKLRVNAMYRMDGYITVDGLSMDVLVKGMQDRNRALDGDLVAVRLYPESEWKPLNDETEKRAATGGTSKPISSSAGINKTALHSLWLPSLQAGKCFFERPPDEEESVDMLKQSMARLNKRIKESRCRPTAAIVFILAQGNANGYVGSLEAKTKVKDLNSPLSSNDNYAYFNADDLRLPRHIRIPRLQLPDEFISRPLLYSKTMLCFCRIKAWSTRHQSPMGEFVKTVGEYTGIETGISAILSKHGLQSHTLDFDSSILTELDDKYGTSGEKWEVPAEELQKRRDFRDTQIFSIDPYNARDLDDALHIRALDDARTKFEIGVHIADRLPRESRVAHASSYSVREVVFAAAASGSVGVFGGVADECGRHAGGWS
ncbi:unnamed protein product [Phytophthora lilii]|uniref:Unnamed protein product n=1 Tax=Phytophthora lilii TaxID=2077276 RepID=A0A9W6TXX2_9STRA|nr:unnamed protein product [Phytophthora lilii]